ncbi:hypothetical protein HELRODRAFT_87913, partial [Helobdella robusta]|uniref:Fibrinogen C-terminal domain-containing protein n=1 Tax=Helobdella robusta TaxID=6412 RepID=T1G6W8_HELRO
DWIVIQQRIDGSLSFNKNWITYKLGFGNYNKNYWMGLEKIYQLTNWQNFRLRFEVLINGVWTSDEYDHFKIGSEMEKYRLTVSGYSGDKCNVLNSTVPEYRHNGMYFSTPDQDNDLLANWSCASMTSSGNWFNACQYQRVNSVYGSNLDYAYTRATYIRMMIKPNP